MSDQERRKQVIDDLREMLDWLEAHPDVPLDRYGARLGYSISGEQDERGHRTVADIATALDSTVKTSGSHHRATRSWGVATYEATYIDRDHMAEYSEFMKPWHQRGAS